MPSDQPTPLDRLKSQAFKKGQEAWGTAYIFDVRARRLKKRLNRLDFVGVAVPLLAGLIVLGFGAELQAWEWVIGVCTVIGGAQAIVFLWALVAGWLSAYDRSLQSVVTNRELADSFDTLGRFGPDTVEAFTQRFNLLKAKDDAQRSADNKEGLSGAEQRMGMRAMLRQFHKECRGCRNVPLSMDPSSCRVCGDYPKRWSRF